MSFLAPLFFLGGLSVVLPIVFHLIRRSARRKMPFSTLMFLEPTPPRITRRSRIEHWLLLLLRCLALILLATGFARPFWIKKDSVQSTAAPARIHCYLLDASASMRRPDIWPEAKVMLLDRLSENVDTEPTALFVFDSEARSLVGFDEWQATPADQRGLLFRSALESLEPSWRGTNLAAGILQAHDAIDDYTNRMEQESGEVEIRMTLISDFQEGTDSQALQGLAWKENLSVDLVYTSAKTQGNTSMQPLPFLNEDFRGTESLTARFVVQNGIDSETSAFTLNSNPPSRDQPVEVHLPPGQSRVVQWPLVDPEQACVITLEGDGQVFDNRIHLIPPKSVHERVYFYGDKEEDDPQGLLFYLRKALPDSSHRSFTVQVSPAPDTNAIPRLCVAASPSADEDTLNHHLDQGGTVLVVLESREVVDWLQAWAGIDLRHSKPARSHSYYLWSHIDFEHPVFKPFLDVRFNNFANIHFWNYFPVQIQSIANSKVLATFDSGDPAFWEMPLRNGKLLVLTSGWSPEMSQLARSTKFVPLLISILDYAGNPGVSGLNLVTDDPFPTSLSNGEAVTKIRNPDGVDLPWENQPFSEMRPEKPGIYELSTASGSYPVSVNMPWRESLTRPLPEEDLRALGIPGASGIGLNPSSSVPERMTLSNSEAESRQKVWKWLLIGVIGLLGLEGVIGLTSVGKTAVNHSPIS